MILGVITHTICKAIEKHNEPEEVEELEEVEAVEDAEAVEDLEEAEELLARCICHENDHLDGILFIDKSVDGKIYKADSAED